VAGCAKHFVGDGGTVNGINENNTIVSQHGLYSIHMPAYYDSIIKGVATVMASYSSLNGIKMHANRQMLTGFLKDTLKFKAFSYLFYLFCFLHKFMEKYFVPKTSLTPNVLALLQSYPKA
jgi:hypothetical protein